jgi:hypothetical protein
MNLMATGLIECCYLDPVLSCRFPPSSDVELEESYHMYDRAHRETRNCSTLYTKCPTSLLEPSSLL